MSSARIVPPVTVNCTEWPAVGTTVPAESLALGTELDEANDFLESLLVSQRGGLVVIDADLRIIVWNDHSAELWGLRPDEAPGTGRHSVRRR